MATYYENFTSSEDSSDDESNVIVAAATAVLLAGATALSTTTSNSKSRTLWVSELNGERERYGAFNSTMVTLEISDAREWQNYMRMDKDLFTALLHSVQELISKQDTRLRKAIPPAERLALTLRYLATGESFASLHFQFRMGKSTIAKVIPEVCLAIFQCLKSQYMRTPSSEEEWKKVSKEYYDRWNFPHCLGALDGKHVLLRKPWHAGSTYHNYKGTESIVLMAISDANYK